MTPVGGKMTETELASSLRRAAKDHGWIEHVAWVSMHSPKGWPDLTFAKGLFLVVWELKNETGKATPDQIVWLDWWRNFSVHVHQVPASYKNRPQIHVALVRPKDIEAAYWLLVGEQPDATHPWPAPWDIDDPLRGRP
jgi:hypothetical protein